MKQHPLCTDPDHGPTVMDLPIAQGLKSGMGRTRDPPAFPGQSREGAGLGRAGQPGWRPDAYRRCASRDRGCPRAESLRLPHFAPKAKRAIYLFMSGGPPQMDLLDYKPNLAPLYDKDIPDSVRGAQQLTGMTAGQARFPIAPSHWAFKQYGKIGHLGKRSAALHGAHGR